MWKYVTRRIRDTFERSASHFDRCSTTVVNSAPGNFSEEKNKQPCCKWFSRNCTSFENDSGPNRKKWNFDYLNKSWMDAITWSGALVLGWYTSQIIHLKLKHHLRVNQSKCLTVNDIITSLKPHISSGEKNNFYLTSAPKISIVVSDFAPRVHLVSNESYHTESGCKNEKSAQSGSSTSQDSSTDDLGEVLNSIENKLGLAAIENGQYQDGLNLLRSAANRNHAPAMYNLGLCYENGLGVSTNEKMAMEFYRSAAALKHPGALYNLGVFYGQGRGGLKIDQETATRLLRLAAVQGQQDAINALKALEDTIPENPNKDRNGWSYPHSPFLQNDNYIPTQTRLFVENINCLQAQV
ncbi:unnamed protein product [Arctia plantaginis]|uniref:Uncharacterized protein n=1 Tax=Arctia plantaginis TaxID=874455 RepID=A0A8S0ZUG2_ARCPL|nr:unnamed protein product [Arctia plantaginis]CAB3238378.1 unnamed protein product [Arctia plantaginis]